MPRLKTSAIRLHLSGWLVLAASIATSAGAQISSEGSVNAPVSKRVETTDPATGIHSVRLLLSLQKSSLDGTADPPPRFTVECQDSKGKHNLLWFVSFGGIDDPGFVHPFIPTPGSEFPPQYPAFNLKMSFEGYIRSKPFTRSWSLLPSGELSYRNPGMSSPNMDSTQYFMTFLNSLPGLRIGYAKAGKGQASREVFFQTQPLLDELRKTPICLP